MSAYQNVTEWESLLCEEDLSSDKYRFVVRDETTMQARRPDAATDFAIGVLYNAPTSGQECKVAVQGVCKVLAGEALAVNALVRPEYIDAADAGKAIGAGTAEENVAGIVVGAAAAEGDLATIRLLPNARTSHA